MAKAAAPLLIGAGALAILAAGKKKPKSRFGIRVSKDCRVEVTDEERYLAFVRGGYLDERADNPEDGPLEISESLFKDVAPHCHHFPEAPETMDIYRLYLNILGFVSTFMVDDDAIKPKEILELREELGFDKWANHHLERLGKMWGAIPENQVGFAKDFSEFRIGEDWEEDTLAPFVIQGKKEGLTNQQIYDAFVAKKSVMVGEFRFVRIADLPENEPKVQEFLEHIIEGIEAAG